MVNFLTATGVPLLNQHVCLRVLTKKNHSVPLCAFYVFSRESAGTCCFCNYSCKGRWWSNHFIRNLTLDSSREDWMKRFLSHREIIVRIPTLLPASIPSSSSIKKQYLFIPISSWLFPSQQRPDQKQRVHLGSSKISVHLSFLIYSCLSTAASFSFVFFTE